MMALLAFHLTTCRMCKDSTFFILGCGGSGSIRKCGSVGVDVYCRILF